MNRDGIELTEWQKQNRSKVSALVQQQALVDLGNTTSNCLFTISILYSLT